MTQYVVKLMKRQKTPSKLIAFYVVKDGELETTTLNNRTVYKSGVKVTPNLAEATRFATMSEAVKYHSLLGMDGKRGQIVKVEDKS